MTEMDWQWHLYQTALYDEKILSKKKKKKKKYG